MGWNEDHRGRVLFTDETRIGLWAPNTRTLRVWKRKGERFSQAYIFSKERFTVGTVLFWGGIAYDVELLPLLRHALTEQRNVLEILDGNGVPFAPYIWPHFLVVMIMLDPTWLRMSFSTLMKWKLQLWNGCHEVPNWTCLNMLKRHIRRRNRLPEH